ncbi:DUF6520 family protein [Flavivirga abyssicola]|uniref:DUF6520 family protein n=1 Tax=Flavivirga abyssicola TaxID=3063533 RepID=UPI0026DF441A|nr:DUF6520 family protein [Flavivirga sp. MEBiC07777]WVK14148.1 DUF6520 family protein [Flavivirga sp. MEBiC07777]
MKSKIFKTVFPAFALMLAIMASLALTSANNDVAEKEEDATKITIALYKNGIGQPCVEVQDVCCQEEVAEELCTINVNGIDRQLFKARTHTSCNILLYKWQGY